MNLDRAQRGVNNAGICRLLIFKTCDAENLGIAEVNPDLVEFIEDLDFMFKVVPDSGQYLENDSIDNNGVSYQYQVNFTVAKDRIDQRAFVRQYSNKPLGAFVLNHNKQWKYLSNLTLRSTTQSGRTIGNLNNVAYSLFGNGMSKPQFAEKQIQSVNLTTEWNEAIDGNFIASITSSETARWIFPSGLEVLGNSVNVSGTGLDGSTQEVKIAVADFNSITAVNFTACKLVGIIDLSLIVFNGACLMSQNPTLTNVNFSDAGLINEITTLQLNNCDITGLLNLLSTKVNNNLLVGFNPNLTNIDHVILSSGKNSIANGYDVQSTNMTDINFNDFQFDAAVNSVLFRSVGFTVGEIDSMLAKIDAVSIAGTATMRFDGTNATPTLGLLNPNILSLVTKGYTIVINP